MPAYDFRMQRLFVEAPLRAGGSLGLGKAQANYVINVLRLRVGDPVLVFNGYDGEWRAELAEAGRKRVVLALREQTRDQTKQADLDYLFAPLKHARLDYMVQKAVEMGAGRLRPVLTQHSQASRVNLDRMRANIIEAAEQCGILGVPEVLTPIRLADVIRAWPESDSARRLIYCDEAAAVANPIDGLRGIGRGPLAVLIGPEGGFSSDERALLNDQEFVTAVALGPRILRADTAAVAALGLVQAVLGDWG